MISDHLRPCPYCGKLADLPDFSVNLEWNEIVIDGRRMRLSTTLTDLAMALWRAYPHPVAAQRQTVLTLRRRLAKTPVRIIGERGRGYRLEWAPAVAARRAA